MRCAGIDVGRAHPFVAVVDEQSDVLKRSKRFAAMEEGFAVLRSVLEEPDDRHDAGKLLLSIDGVGLQSAARVVAAVDDPAKFASGEAFAACLGVVPGTRRSGSSTPRRAPTSSFGNHDLRRAPWMPTMGAVRRSPWLKANCERLVARGKPKKAGLPRAIRSGFARSLPCRHAPSAMLST